MANEKKWQSMDGNAAAAYSAHAMSEVIAIYPITPSSPMAEISDEFSADARENIFGQVPTVYEMQSEGGAVAAIHGAMAAGTLTTTFTASQGLLLMIPSMYKIAGELMPTVFNVTARTISTHALSIFGDHSDVMGCRQTGFALLASANQQEALDQAAIAMAVSINSSLPFLHFFDGFRTSHEISKVELLPYETMRALVDMDALARFRNRALNPDRPVLKGTAMNPDIWFQGAETRNPQHAAVPGVLKAAYKKFEELTGRSYKPFEYYGDPNAETLLVAMGSGAEVVRETVLYLNKEQGMKLGLLQVRLYRPWSDEDFAATLPKSVKNVVVLDRTKEPGSGGEPLYLDVVAALENARRKGHIAATPTVIGGRYGLSSKDFTPSMVLSIVKHVTSTTPDKWIHGFTVGIDDDVSHTSLPVGEIIDTEDKGVHRLKFWGLGSDGTVGANKNSIKMIGDNSAMCVQGHFVYDSKKAGGTTISHLRFSPTPILSHYEIDKPDFVAIHNREFLGKYELLAGLRQGGTVLINTDLPLADVFASFPKRDQEILIAAKGKLYAIDANKVVNELGMPGRINTTMQAAFFRITKILDEQVVLKTVEKAIHKSYGKKGEKVVDLNMKAFTKGLDSYSEVPIPTATVGEGALIRQLKADAKDAAIAPIIENVIDRVAHFEGHKVRVSELPIDGVFPTATTRYEKRSIATHVPNWDSSLCIQCGQCAFGCPHAAVRTRIHNQADIQMDAAAYPTLAVKGKQGGEDKRFRVQVFADDCTGCGVCVELCLGKNKETGKRALELVPKYDVLETLRRSEQEFQRLPPTDLSFTDNKTTKGTQLVDPLFEFSGACPGCGETPYIKLVTQMVGDHMIQSNATGCSSIYGGTAPTVPYCKNEKGRGPAWVSSLFEDNAEHGLGVRLGVESLQAQAWAIKAAVEADAGACSTLKGLLEKIAPPDHPTGRSRSLPRLQSRGRGDSRPAERRPRGQP